MKEVLKKAWGEEDFTAEDLIFSGTSGVFRELLEEDDSCQRTISPRPLHAVCSWLHSWSPNDFTPRGPSLEAACTLALRSAVVGDTLEELLSKDVDVTEWNDYFNEELLEIGVAFENFVERQKPIFAEIYEVYKECAEENWDGYDAVQISRKAYLEAMKLAELLPDNLPSPEVLPEPNGEIAFEWYRGKRFVFVASVGGEEVINYAGLFGTKSKEYGTEFFGNQFPKKLAEKIERLFV